MIQNVSNAHYSLGARWIHTMTGPPLENGFVNVADGLIESIASKPAFSTVYDFGEDTQILPGTVNAHSHLELSQLDAPIPATSFADWIGRLMEFRRSDRYDAVQGIWSAFLKPEVLSETVAIDDIVPPGLDIPKVPAMPVWRRFVEVIDWKHGAGPRTDVRGSFGLSPHAPQTVHRDVLQEIVKLNIPLAMHLAETQEELRLLRSHDGLLLDLMRRADPEYDPKTVLLGKRPMDYLALLAEAPSVRVIHGNYLDDEELAFLAKHRDTMAVVYCPRSHAHFGHERYPLKKMLDLGVRVRFGTDSLASTPDLSVVNEMKFVLQTHQDVLPETVFRLGTRGTLAPGKTAIFSFA